MTGPITPKLPTAIGRVWSRGPLRESIVVGVVAALVVVATSGLKPTRYNNYVLLADAFLHGRLWINWPGGSIDAILFNGHRFIVNDPVPGLLLIPAVAVFGPAANQTILGVELAGVATGAAWYLCRAMELRTDSTLWLTSFFLMGTDLWWCSSFGDVWFVAQTSAVAFLTLSLAELLRFNRAWLVTAWFVLAVGSRFTVVMALPVIAVLSAMRADQSGRSFWRQTRAVVLTLLPAALLWAGYNELRWGVPWDVGHTMFYHEDPVGSPFGSPFNIAYLPYQLESFLLAPPRWLGKYPWFSPELSGTALTWTTPALALAFAARRPAIYVRAMWAAAVLAAAPSLLYYMNGYAQFGMRHALDFTPFLFVLMVLACRDAVPTWGRVLIVYSVAATGFGIWFWRTFFRD